MKKAFTVFSGWLLLLLLGFSQGFAQQQVSGRILDAATGDPLPGATVTSQGGTTGTVSGEGGRFTLAVSPGDTLAASMLGYETKQLVYSGQKDLTVKLQQSSHKLNQLVVVGYGKQKKSSLTTAISSISAKEIQKQVSGNVASALQGRAPGVRILQQGGIAGGDVNILIRGTASFGSTQPLIIIDGAFSAAGLTSLNPANIESIEVLKDGAAAAIYGSRAANGVIIITTKNGKKGAPVINFNANYSIQSPTKRLDYLNASQWRSFANQVADNSGIARAPENDHPSNPSLNTDWQDLWFRYAPIYNANLSISGGGNNITYYSSIGYFDQTGMIETSSFKRYNIQFNASYHKNRLKIDENLAITYKDKTPTPVLTMPLPTLPAYDKDGNLISGGTNYYIEGNIKSNPLALPHFRDAYTKNIDVLGSLNLNYSIVQGLEYRLNLAGSLNNSHGYTHTPEYYTKYLSNGEPDPDYGNTINSLSENKGTEFNYNIDNLLEYKKDFGLHDIDFLLGTSWLKNSFRAISISSVSDLGGPNITGIDGDGKISAGEQKYALFSIFTRLNYSYAGKYLFSGSIRRDASSKFYRDSRVGYFPSISAGWNISQENFLRSNLISNLKLRASYGELGANFIDPYGFNSLAFGPVPAIMGTKQNRVYGRVIYLADKGLKWETAVSKDIGLDIGFLDNSLTFSLDYFIKTNRDLLARLELTPSSGQTIVINEGFRPYVNSASVQNKGFGFLMEYKKMFNNDFSITSSLNLSIIKNEVLELGQNVQPIRGELLSGSFNDRPTITKKGLPIGSFIGYKIKGIDDNGDFIFEDNNGLDPNGKLTGQPDDQVDENDKVILGNPFPDFTYGLNISMAYRRFDLTLFVQGVQGNEIFNARKYTNYFEYDHNVVTDVLNAWTPENTETNIPRMIIANRSGGNALPSSFYIEDGSYLRLKNFRIGYTIGTQNLSKVNISKMRIFAGAQNLFTITKYTGYDPEVSSDVLFNRGVDYNAFPNARIVTVGFSATF